MTEEPLHIINKLGLHARAAAKLVDCAGRFGARVALERDGQIVDAKSIMAVMMLAAGQGSVLTLRCVGDDASEANAAIQALVQDKFGEPE